MPALSVVIPSFNRRECVLALLADVYRQRGADFEVIVVDDQSSDGSPEAIRREFPQAALWVNEKNGGPAVSRNSGIRAAQGEIIVGFDSDVTLPDPHLLARVQQSFAEQPATTGFAFRLFQPDGATDDTPRWWHPLPIQSFAHQPFETCYFSGTAYAFRRLPMVDAGLFPEILYMHYEEVELALRILQRGGFILYSPHLTAVHHANPVSRRSQVRVFYKPRNQILLTLRLYPALRGMAYLTPRLANGALQAALGGYLGDWFRALRSAASLTPECLQAREPLPDAVWKRIAAMKRPPHKPNPLEADMQVRTNFRAVQP